METRRKTAADARARAAAEAKAEAEKRVVPAPSVASPVAPPATPASGSGELWKARISIQIPREALPSPGGVKVTFQAEILAGEGRIYPEMGENEEKLTCGSSDDVKKLYGNLERQGWNLREHIDSSTGMVLGYACEKTCSTREKLLGFLQRTAYAAVIGDRRQLKCYQACIVWLERALERDLAEPERLRAEAERLKARAETAEARIKILETKYHEDLSALSARKAVVDAALQAQIEKTSAMETKHQEELRSIEEEVRQKIKELQDGKERAETKQRDAELGQQHEREARSRAEETLRFVERERGSLEANAKQLQIEIGKLSQALEETKEREQKERDIRVQAEAELKSTQERLRKTKLSKAEAKHAKTLAEEALRHEVDKRESSGFARREGALGQEIKDAKQREEQERERRTEAEKKQHETEKRYHQSQVDAARTQGEIKQLREQKNQLEQENHARAQALEEKTVELEGIKGNVAKLQREREALESQLAQARAAGNTVKTKEYAAGLKKLQEQLTENNAMLSRLEQDKHQEMESAEQTRKSLDDIKSLLRESQDKMLKIMDDKLQTLGDKLQEIKRSQDKGYSLLIELNQTQLTGNAAYQQALVYLKDQLSGMNAEALRLGEERSKLMLQQSESMTEQTQKALEEINGKITSLAGTADRVNVQLAGLVTEVHQYQETEKATRQQIEQLQKQRESLEKEAEESKQALAYKTEDVDRLREALGSMLEERDQHEKESPQAVPTPSPTLDQVAIEESLRKLEEERKTKEDHLGEINKSLAGINSRLEGINGTLLSQTEAADSLRGQVEAFMEEVRIDRRIQEIHERRLKEIDDRLRAAETNHGEDAALLASLREARTAQDERAKTRSRLLDQEGYPFLRAFYLRVQRFMNSLLLVDDLLLTETFKTQDTMKKEKAASAGRAIGRVIPLLGLLTSAIAGAVKTYADRQKKQRARYIEYLPVGILPREEMVEEIAFGLCERYERQLKKLKLVPERDAETVLSKIAEIAAKRMQNYLLYLNDKGGVKGKIKGKAKDSEEMAEEEREFHRELFKADSITALIHAVRIFKLPKDNSGKCMIPIATAVVTGTGEEAAKASAPTEVEAEAGAAAEAAVEEVPPEVLRARPSSPPLVLSYWTVHGIFSQSGIETRDGRRFDFPASDPRELKRKPPASKGEGIYYTDVDRYGYARGSEEDARVAGMFRP
jgi:chromosome segregation ATPase